MAQVWYRDKQTGERRLWDEDTGSFVDSEPQGRSIDDYLSEQSTGQKVLQGIGRGMVNIGRQTGNILGLISDEEMEGYRQIDEPLMQTTPGQVGNVIGEVAAMAPVAGGLVGGAARLGGRAIPALRGATTAGRWPAIGAGAGMGATEGAIEGAMVAGPGQRGRGAMIGAGLGAATGGILPASMYGFRSPTPEAQTLMDMGVNLDMGYMKPSGAANQIAEVLSNLPVVGQTIKTSRQIPKREFAEQMINRTRAPGADPIDPAGINTMLDRAYSSFEPAYGQLKGYPLNPQTVPGLRSDFLRSVEDPSIDATDDVRKAVGRYLANQVTRFRGQKTPVSDDLLTIRSNLRTQSRKAARAQNWEKAELYDAAEAAVTARINETIPADMVDLNRAIDEQYAKHKIAESAVAKAKGSDYPTPNQWQTAISQATPQGQYARGGGLMRQEADAAADVFRQVTPETGARLLTYGSMAGLGKGAVAEPSTLAAALPAWWLTSTRSGRQFPVGATPLQQMMQRASAPRNFMDIGIPTLPGMYMRSVAPIAGAQE